MISVIGITGPAHVGKSTLAEYLLDELPEFHIYSLADPVKAMVNSLFGWGYGHSHGPLKEVVDPLVGVSPRTAYQRLGTEFGRNALHDFLPELTFPRGSVWLTRAQRELIDKSMLIVPDVRFDDEADWVRQSKGLVVHVRRAGTFGLGDAAKQHASEQGINARNGDWVCEVHSDLAGLRRESRGLADYVRGYRVAGHS